MILKSWEFEILINNLDINFSCLLSCFSASMAPSRKHDITSAAVRALISGTIACFLTACIAGNATPPLHPISLTGRQLGGVGGWSSSHLDIQHLLLQKVERQCYLQACYKVKCVGHAGEAKNRGEFSTLVINLLNGTLFHSQAFSLALLWMSTAITF